MIILTARTENQSPLTEIQFRSCMACGVLPTDYRMVPIEDEYPRHPSWYKLRALIHHLPKHDFILWMDADAMMIGPMPQFPLEWLHDRESPVALAKDINGWNCGVMLWRRCTRAFEVLWSLYDDYERFAKHPWYEQGSFHTKAEWIRPFELKKTVWNAYESDRTNETSIIHFPAMTQEKRIARMNSFLKTIEP